MVAAAWQTKLEWALPLDIITTMKAPGLPRLSDIALEVLAQGNTMAQGGHTEAVAARRFDQEGELGTAWRACLRSTSVYIQIGPTPVLYGRGA